MTAHREVEIRVRLPADKSGPADVLTLLAHHQLPTLTRSCCADREGLLLLLITNRREEVQQVLETAGYVCEAHPVVLIGPTTYRPGVVARLLAELRQHGVDIWYSYLSSITADRCFVVIKTTDNERALELMTTA